MIAKILSILSILKKCQPAARDAVLLFARLTIGWGFFQAGKGKLGRLDQVTGFFESLDIPAPGFHAVMVANVEMIGGLMLLAGLLSRIAAVPLTIAMSVAYLTAHREDAFASLGAFADEAPYAYLLVALIVLVFGPGRASIDQIIKSRFGNQIAH